MGTWPARFCPDCCQQQVMITVFVASKLPNGKPIERTRAALIKPPLDAAKHQARSRSSQRVLRPLTQLLWHWWHLQVGGCSISADLPAGRSLTLPEGKASATGSWLLMPPAVRRQPLGMCNLP